MQPCTVRNIILAAVILLVILLLIGWYNASRQNPAPGPTPISEAAGGGIDVSASAISNAALAAPVVNPDDEDYEDDRGGKRSCDCYRISVRRKDHGHRLHGRGDQDGVWVNKQSCGRFKINRHKPVRFYYEDSHDTVTLYTKRGDVQVKHGEIYDFGKHEPGQFYYKTSRGAFGGYGNIY